MVISLGRTRLVAHGLITRPYTSAAEVMAAFGPMQGQDLPGVLSSVALRLASGSVTEVIESLNDATVVRGYPMRGTWFLLPAADARWITELCAQASLRAARSRAQELHGTILDRARETACSRLAETTLSRAELLEAWEHAGISTAAGAGYHLIFTLIAEGALCFGPWNGTDQDFVLTEQWLPAESGLAGSFNDDRVAAVAELLRRYLLTRGPATIRDFTWWSKLTLAESRQALQLIADDLETDGAEEPAYWRPGLLEETAALGRASAVPLLLPGFDEFILGYEDRLFAMSQAEHHQLVPGNNGVFKRSIVRNGRVVGTWSRAGRPGKRSIALSPFGEMTAAAEKRVTALFHRFPFPAE